MEFMDEIIKLYENGDFSTVNEKMTDFLNKNPKYKTIDYYHFSNPLEEVLYDFYVGDIKTINQLDLDEPLDELYHIYAITYIEDDNLDMAEKYLKIANKINPVSCNVLMGLCELYQQKNQEEELEKLTQDIFKYTYDVGILTSNYFKLADYLYHTNQKMELYEHLINLFLFLKSQDADSIKDDLKYLRENNVQIGFNEEIIKMLLYLIDVFNQNERLNSAEYFKNILENIVNFNGMLFKIENDGQY